MARPKKTSLVPMEAPPGVDMIDLGPINGKDIALVAENTLRHGESLLKHWVELEPIVEELIKRVRRLLTTETQIVDTIGTLAQIAGVVEKITRASSSVMKASEGLSRLGVLLSGGVKQRPDTKQLSEKQLASVVVEACKRIFADSGVCPVCAPPAVDVTPTEVTQ